MIPADKTPARPATNTVPPPVTDAEVQTALAWLKRYPSGMTRDDLRRVFGSDRRGRDVIAALGERGIAPIVVVRNELSTTVSKVYRLARSEAELEAEERRLLAYELSHQRRREGIRRAWQSNRDAEPPQAPLFAEETP
jgi:hypothetical protein